MSTNERILFTFCLLLIVLGMGVLSGGLLLVGLMRP